MSMSTQTSAVAPAPQGVRDALTVLDGRANWAEAAVERGATSPGSPPVVQVIRSTGPGGSSRSWRRGDDGHVAAGGDHLPYIDGHLCIAGAQSSQSSQPSQ